MKRFNKIIIFFVLILIYSTDIFAYSYGISNRTGRDIKVQLYAGLIKLNKKAKIIKKGKNYPFRYPLGHGKAGLCLTKIMVATKKKGGWRDMVQLREAIWDGKFWKTELYPDYLFGICGSRNFTLYWGEFPEIEYIADAFTGVYTLREQVKQIDLLGGGIQERK